MDFEFSAEQQALREEFESFFREEAKRAPESWVGGMLEASFGTDEGWAYHRSVAEKLAERGWISLPWPKEYGGQGHGYVEQLIFNEVRAYHRVPGVDLHGPQAVAAGILEYGSEEMKKEWLPRIARAEINWTEGLSEPGAGSDLASVTARGVEDGDDYLVNGQKTWTSGAHRADHIFLLVRTDASLPRHKGLTYFLSEMDRPGIGVRPLLSMDGRHFFNEVFLDNVRIPKRNIVGQANQGWYVTMAGRNFARAMVGSVAEAKRDLEDLIQFCREAPQLRQDIIRRSVISQHLAELAIEIEMGRCWAYYVAWLQTKGEHVIIEAAASKYTASELNVRLANIGVDIMGLYGILKEGSKYAALKGKFESLCQSSLGYTIAGGSTEIEKNIIAWKGLGLPRMR